MIGSGAGGAVAAARLAESGLDVVILEEGGHYAGNGFTESEAEMMPALYADAGMRATDDLSVQILQGRTIGGGSTVNWLVMLRTPDWVLQEWMFEHGAEGMSASELAPIFERVERETHTRAVPNDAHSPNNRMILEGASALGWHAAVASINAKGCVRSGFCGLGCRYGAKQGALATYIPSALRGGARIFSDVRAERIEIVGRAGKAGGNPLKRVHATVLDRHTARPRGRLTVDAPIVVLAGGAVGTPTLLQRSGMGGGGVGDYLRLHPTTTVIGIHDREIYGAGGIPLSAICDQFVRGDGSGYGFWIECPPMHPGLASVAMSGFGEPHREMMIRFPRLGALIVLVRDGADRTLSSGRVWVDPTGRTRIRYRLSETDLVQMREGIVAAARLQLAAGAREVVTLHTPPRSIRGESDLSALATADCSPNRLGLFSAHVNGTCRFGTDPRTSGCTPDGQRHGVRGLYVADGSLLPTALGVNPQETIMAVATVVAGRITGK
ncbi:MAG: GMC family oxidoreductase [Gemmatimonadota bacterium]|nr:GMC family oxidoreductase [Gemmatimonadota bacterium]